MPELDGASRIRQQNIHRGQLLQEQVSKAAHPHLHVHESPLLPVQVARRAGSICTC